MAEPVKLEGNKVQVVVNSCTNGFNLSLFPPSEQKRIKAALGITERPSAVSLRSAVPPELKGLWEEIAAQRRRAEARAKAGKMTREALEEYNRNLDAAWEHYKGMGESDVGS